MCIGDGNVRGFSKKKARRRMVTGKTAAAVARIYCRQSNAGVSFLGLKSRVCLSSSLLERVVLRETRSFTNVCVAHGDPLPQPVGGGGTQGGNRLAQREALQIGCEYSCIRN